MRFVRWRSSRKRGVCVCVHANLCVFVCVFAYTCVCVHMSACKCARVRVRGCVRVRVCQIWVVQPPICLHTPRCKETKIDLSIEDLRRILAFLHEEFIQHMSIFKVTKRSFCIYCCHVHFAFFLTNPLSVLCARACVCVCVHSAASSVTDGANCSTPAHTCFSVFLFFSFFVCTLFYCHKQREVL